MGGACFLKKPEAGKTEALGAGQRALLREREENKAGDNWERRLKLLQAEKSRREISHPTSGNPRLRVQANLPEETKGKEKPKQSPTGLSQRSRFGPTRFVFFFNYYCISITRGTEPAARVNQQPGWEGKVEVHLREEHLKENPDYHFKPQLV